MTDIRTWSVAIRADGSARIGIGHLKRMLALAGSLSAHGARVTFVCQQIPPALVQAVEDAGHRLMRLADPLPAHAQAEATLAAIDATGSAAVVVDHYDLGLSYWATVSQAVPLAAIDDTGRAELTSDVRLVVNQNAGAEASWYPLAADVLCGPRFVMLDSAFAATGPVRRRSGAPRVLVSMGGADPRNLTVTVLELLRSRAGVGPIDAVIGPCFAAPEETVRRLEATTDLAVHRAPPSLLPLMREADLAIVAGGSTLYECAALGLPAVALQIVDNQARLCAALARAGAIRLIDASVDLPQERLAEAIDEMLEPGFRRAVGESAHRLVDGRGADRVAAAVRRLAHAPASQRFERARSDHEPQARTGSL